jgi:hypothetical protein
MAIFRQTFPSDEKVFEEVSSVVATQTGLV